MCDFLPGNVYLFDSPAPGGLRSCPELHVCWPHYAQFVQHQNLRRFISTKKCRITKQCTFASTMCSVALPMGALVRRSVGKKHVRGRNMHLRVPIAVRRSLCGAHATKTRQISGGVGECTATLIVAFSGTVVLLASVVVRMLANCMPHHSAVERKVRLRRAECSKTRWRVVPCGGLPS